MTVSSTASRVVYQGNGSTTAFPFAFPVMQQADLVVIYTDAGGNACTLGSGQYSVTGLGSPAGGTVTYPLSGGPIASGTTLMVQRALAPTQPSTISNQGAMWPQVIEGALDRVVMIIQGFLDGLGRSLQIAPNDGAALDPLPPAAQRANSVLGFDGNGQPYAATLASNVVSIATWCVNNFLNAATSAAAACAALGAQQVATLPGLMRSYLAGLVLSNDGTTPNSVLDISAGVCADSTNATLITLGAVTKSTAGAWAAGPGGNGMGQGLTVANATWYHVFAIINGGAADVYFDTSATAANRPAGTTAWRRIGSFLTNGSAQIVAFHQYGDEFYWDVPRNDLSATALSTSARVARTLSAAPGTVAIFDAIVSNEVQNVFEYVIFTTSDQPDQAAGATSFSIAGWSVTPGYASPSATGNDIRIKVDAGSRMYDRDNQGGVATYVTRGWVDTRGRNL